MLDQAVHKVNDWVKYLSEEDMPVFSGTVTDVTNAVNSEDTSATDVARVILRDASLTGRLLRMANNIFYNPMRHEINTISRAVMVLGFEQVRALTLSLVLVDTLAAGNQRDILTDEMAQAFHAAIQAQELAKCVKSPSPENVFIATLLSRLGNMAFWAFSGKNADAMLALLQRGDINEEAAEKQVLGFTLRQLTIGLSKSWSLGELLDKSLAGENDDPRVNLILLGHDLAASAKHGWDSKQAKDVMEQVAISLDISVAEVAEMVKGNAKQARDITRMYGIPEASKKIPQAQVEVIENENFTDTDASLALSEVAEELLTVEPFPEPDTHKQLTILQDINNAIQEKPSINIILEMVLEGIHRGVGMDRAMFAILSRDRKNLVCKYALGVDSENLIAQLAIDVTQPTNIFNQTLNNKRASLISGNPKELGGTIARDTLEKIGKPPYLLMPTIVKGKVIGLFMADRNASGREITQEDFVAFQQFCQQANMGLTFLSMQG